MLKIRYVPRDLLSCSIPKKKSCQKISRTSRQKMIEIYENLRQGISNHQSFSALKKIACARAQRSDGNSERRSRSRLHSIFRQPCALARAQYEKSAAQFCAHFQKIS